MSQLWDRREKESSVAYEAFTLYMLDGPQRSHNATAKRVGKSRQLLDKWGRTHDWARRVRAYDDSFRKRDQTNARKKRTEAVQGHLTAANALMTQALTRLRPTPVTDANGVVIIDPTTGHPYLKPAEAAELNAAANALDKAIKHQRLALGLPTDLSRQDVYLQDALKRALDVQRAVQSVIEETLCESCRATVGEELNRLAAEHEEIELEVST